ncbi:pyridoxal phosphate-dependent transferase [Nemania sp. FL0916]|nr:pyridoxal phosphate-dependent transferase [Nemania sp. FL0916]
MPLKIGSGYLSRHITVDCLIFSRRLITTTRNRILTQMHPLRMTAGQSLSGASEDKEMRHTVSHRNTTPSQAPSQSKKPINLLRGWPAASLLPAESLRIASQTALSDPAIWSPGLEYGPDPGYQPLREALARWLGRFYRDVIPAPAGSGTSDESPQPRAATGGKEEDEANRITITGGASQSLACLLQSFTDPARTLAVWLVAPCYFLACPIFADAGFAGRMRAVPEDDEGVDVTVLEREMCALEKEMQDKADRGESGLGLGSGYKEAGPHRKIYRHVVYCVPSFSNPSGCTMTLARRWALVDLARRHDALVVCDDVYDMLQWRVQVPATTTTSTPSSTLSSSQPSPSPQNLDFHKAILPRVVDLDLAAARSPHDPAGKHFGHVVSNGSFSKLVGPGVRTGWTYSTADFAFGTSQTGSTRSGGAASQLAATIVCQLLPPPPPQSSSQPGSGSTSRDEVVQEATRGKGVERKNGKDGEEQVEEKEERECLLDIHIRHTLLPSYSRRHATLLRAARATLVPLGVRVHEASLRGRDDVFGGYFLWMTLPASSDALGSKDDSNISNNNSSSSGSGDSGSGSGSGSGNGSGGSGDNGGGKPWPTAQAIAERCRADEALMIGNGELFAVHGDEAAARFERGMRLCFAWEDEADLVDGVERLGRVIRAMLEEGPKGWAARRGDGDGDGDVGAAK